MLCFLSTEKVCGFKESLFNEIKYRYRLAGSIFIAFPQIAGNIGVLLGGRKIFVSLPVAVATDDLFSAAGWRDFARGVIDSR
jgi:hypothetical protein